MRIIIVYDDIGKKSEIIEDIIGDKGFADVVVKKRRLEEYYYDEIRKEYPDLIWKKIHSAFEYANLAEDIKLYSADDTKIIHCFSNYLITDGEKASLSFQKLLFIDKPYGILQGKRAVAAMFSSATEYLSFCKNVISGQKAWDLICDMKDSFEIEGVVDIGIINNFIQCVTGNFDSRYFNSLKGNEYTLIKSSSNKKKIKAEYCFYQLLPEDMKFWFIMPYDYKESNDNACYTMERLYITDIAVKWVHGSIDENEFEELMDKYFFFFQSRHEKACTQEEYDQKAKSLYTDKVNKRIEALKKLQGYEKIKVLLDAFKDTNIDWLVDKYFELKNKIEGKAKYPNCLVIGHGDPCFSNALYNKSTRTLKFIDPKGAITEDELWTNPYYDLAKLSHSVCGRYDFFNNMLFDIRIDVDFSYRLEIPFDNSRYIDIFKRKVEKNGFDYWLVRIYEVSLFLSMLPLHIDNPYKVFGFILNARNILKEIEENV